LGVAVYVGVAVCVGVGVALWVGDGVLLTSATTGATDATGLGVLSVGDLDPPPATEPMMTRTSRPTDTPETDRILPRCVCGLPHANWYNFQIR
jgi:hypothetical protein